jgi:hypothetical protein
MKSRNLLPLVALLALGPIPARASLSADLQALVTRLGVLETQLAAVEGSDLGACAELGTLNTSIEDYAASVGSLTAALPSPLTLATGDLTSLQSLSAASLRMAWKAAELSVELRAVEGVQELFEYRAALSAMLRLSQDIGIMADRILEMADRILVMADNIGLMADRILLTQQLQSSNVALVQAALLTTQQNLVALSSSASTIAYNLTLGQLKLDTKALADRMGATTLTSSNLSTQLLADQAAVAVLLGRTESLAAWVLQNSQVASHWVDGDTLTLLGDLSVIHRALALALERYAGAVEALAPFAGNTALRDATAAMLQLARDIGAMSNRIVEMGDRIVVMADNVGVMAGRIVTTQELQQSNVTLTQSSLLTAQAVAIAAIQSYGL